MQQSLHPHLDSNVCDVQDLLLRASTMIQPRSSLSKSLANAIIDAAQSHHWTTPDLLSSLHTELDFSASPGNPHWNTFSD